MYSIKPLVNMTEVCTICGIGNDTTTTYFSSVNQFKHVDCELNRLKKVITDSMKIRSEPLGISIAASSNSHSCDWKPYVGLVERYEYCDYPGCKAKRDYR